MKLVTFLFLIIFQGINSFGQDKFVGRYKRLLELSDTLLNPPPNYLYPKSFVINSNFTYTYTEEEDAGPYEKPMRESINGSWKFNGDTITFFNKNYKRPKGYKYNYYPNQTFKGIKLVVVDANLKPLDIEWCTLDSTDISTKTNYMSKPYRLLLKDTILVNDTNYNAISFKPKGFCEEFNDCEFSLGLYGIKSGTLIELIVYSRAMDIKFDGKSYILTRNILHEVSTKCYLPDDWTDNFIRKK
jgi:hypothetical protein